MPKRDRRADDLLGREIRNIQNPAFGAALLTAFIQSYYEAHQHRMGAPLPYAYVVLPMLMHADILSVISSTNSGLRGMAQKFFSVESAGTDLLLSISRRARDGRPLTSDCIAVMLAARFARLNLEAGTLEPFRSPEFERLPTLPGETKQAAKLGKWFAELTPFEISSILKVAF